MIVDTSPLAITDLERAEVVTSTPAAAADTGPGVGVTTTADVHLVVFGSHAVWRFDLDRESGVYASQVKLDLRMIGAAEDDDTSYMPVKLHASRSRIRHGLVARSLNEGIVSTGNGFARFDIRQQRLIATECGEPAWCMTLDRTNPWMLYHASENGLMSFELKSNENLPVRMDSIAVDGSTKVLVRSFAIASLSNGLLFLSGYDCRLWLVNPRNGRAAVAINQSGRDGKADGEALAEAELNDPTGFCVFDNERKLLISEFRYNLLRQFTFPTHFDSRLFTATDTHPAVSGK